MRLASPAAFAVALLFAQAAFAAESQAARDIRILSADDMQGRLIGSPGGAKARAYLLTRLKEIGVAPVAGGFEHPFSSGTPAKPRNGVNLIGQIAGTGPSDRVLVIVAHYDHLGVRSGEIYNGADDNASGVAGLLAVAEAFRRTPPKHTVIFALVDGEEGGLSGARAFVAKPPVPLSKIALAVNFDMLSKNATDELYVAGAHHFPWLKPHLDRVAAQAPLTLKQGHDAPPWTGHEDWTSQSDHFAFHEKGVPWAYFGVEDHPEYHRPSDDFATVPLAFFAKSVATVVQAARLFDEELDAMAESAGR